MNKIVVASTRRNAGKTSLIIGLTKMLGKECGYLKPLGDRLLYRKKRLWDYDSKLLTEMLQINERPEDISLGFEHSKLRFMYDEETLQSVLTEKAEAVGKGREILFVEGGSELHFGASVHLDPFSVARYLDAKLLLVVSGTDSEIMDDLTFVRTFLESETVKFQGVVINKIKDIEDFEMSYLPDIEAMGVNIVGLIPHLPELTHMPVSYLVDHLFAKVVAGQAGLDKIAKTVFVGAMSVSQIMQDPLFSKPGKLIITSGDRSDVILAALESDTACIVLTNNIFPPSNIVARAENAKVPLLLVPWDTYRTAMQVNLLDPLLTSQAEDKIELLRATLEERIDQEKLLG